MPAKVSYPKSFGVDPQGLELRKLLLSAVSRAEHLKMLLMLQHFNFSIEELDGLSSVIYIQTFMLQEALSNSVVLILQIPKENYSSSASVRHKCFWEGCFLPETELTRGELNYTN